MRITRVRVGAHDQLEVSVIDNSSQLLILCQIDLNKDGKFYHLENGIATPKIANADALDKCVMSNTLADKTDDSPAIVEEESVETTTDEELNLLDKEVKSDD